MMPETGSGVEVFFPVAFFDGDRTIDMGRVPINDAMNFKSFQSIISKKIGVSPHQVTIYFERPSPQLPIPPSAASSRRFPVTNRFNFSSALGERDRAYFLVISKKSRRLRRKQQRQPPQTFQLDNAAVRAPNATNYLAENLVLLRRNQDHVDFSSGLKPNHGFSNGLNPNPCVQNLPFVDRSFPTGSKKIPYLNQGRFSNNANLPYPDIYPPILPLPSAREDNLHTRSQYINQSNKIRSAVEQDRERYLMSLKLNSNVYSDLNVLPRFNRYLGGSSEMTSDDGASTGGLSSSGTSGATSCDVCAAAKRENGGGMAPFHCCKLDVVLTAVFRSPAGPIARPLSSSRLSAEPGPTCLEASNILGGQTTQRDEKESGAGN